MSKTLAERAAEVEKLDRGRTRGNWNSRRDRYGNVEMVSDDYHKLFGVPPLVTDCYTTEGVKEAEDNISFIAHAPQMAQLIAAMAEEIKKAQQNIEFYRKLLDSELKSKDLDIKILKQDLKEAYKTIKGVNSQRVYIPMLEEKVKERDLRIKKLEISNYHLQNENDAIYLVRREREKPGFPLPCWGTAQRTVDHSCSVQYNGKEIASIDGSVMDYKTDEGES